MIELNDRELATLLAALHMWKNAFTDERISFLDFVINGRNVIPFAMSDDIDELCNKLKGGDA